MSKELHPATSSASSARRGHLDPGDHRRKAILTDLPPAGTAQPVQLMYDTLDSQAQRYYFIVTPSVPCRKKLSAMNQCSICQGVLELFGRHSVVLCRIALATLSFVGLTGGQTPQPRSTEAENARLLILLDVAHPRSPNSERERLDAQEALQIMGTNLCPLFLEMLRTNSLSDSDIRRAAVLADVAGSSLEPFASAIGDELFRGTNSYVAAFALSKMSAQVIPIFARALTNQTAEVRFAALSFIHAFEKEPGVVACVDGVIANLESTYEGVRSLAARALGDLGKLGQRAAPALVARLPVEPGMSVRMEIIRALVRLEYRSEEAMRVLRALAENQDESERVRKLAEHALTQMETPIPSEKN